MGTAHGSWHLLQGMPWPILAGTGRVQSQGTVPWGGAHRLPLPMEVLRVLPFLLCWAVCFRRAAAEPDPLPLPADPCPAPSFSHEQATTVPDRQPLDHARLDEEQRRCPREGHPEGAGRGQVPQDLGQLLHQVSSLGAGCLRPTESRGVLGRAGRGLGSGSERADAADTSPASPRQVPG